MSLYIYINNLIFNLKIKILMPHQLVALIVLIIFDNNFNNFNHDFSTICIQNNYFVLIAFSFIHCLM
jgi:hypothetical protein